MYMKTFLIIDDHSIVRTGLTVLLKGFYSDCRVYEAGDGATAIEQLKQHAFNLIIMDIQIPETNSFDLLEYINVKYPLANVLVFSMSAEAIYGARFIKAGAKGYLSKHASIEEVKEAIETVSQGKKYLSASLLDSLLTSKTQNPFDSLSSREFEIANLLLSGATVSEISNLLSVQPTTVATHKARIFEKLKISSLLQLKEMAEIYNVK